MKMLMLRLLPWLLVPLLASAVCAAPSPRPFTGIGILAVPFRDPARTEDIAGTPVYEDPGIARLATTMLADLPHLAPAVQNKADVVYLAVRERRGEWLKVSYDEAGRNGWIFFERSWNFTSWPEFLKGRAVRLLPGLRKNYYALLDKNNDDGHIIANLTGTTQLRVVTVQDDWCFVIAVREGSGWLRWRDRDGRFLVSVDPQFDPQKH